MIREDIYLLTKKLVNIRSINGTKSEREIGEFIERYIREIPYFKQHPDRVIVRQLKNDNLHRRNVLALLIGEKDDNKKTILFHGHTDTVGLEGYGKLEKYATDPSKLLNEMLKLNLDEEVRKDLESGDYMVGRGACDMKSGDAVFLAILKEYAEHPEKLSGNILVSFNPVEENLHTGMIESIEVINELKIKYGLDYILAINNDFICPLFQGDTTKTIYTGMVGKLLPCFYIQGKETHVGQCFEGFDASTVAAKLVDKINLNMDFSDVYQDEYSYPPSVLKVKDLKEWYNVQTAAEAFVYFNYFVHNTSIGDIVEKLKNVASEVFDEALNKIKNNATKFSKLSNKDLADYNYTKLIFTYDELYNIAAKNPNFSEDRLTIILHEEIRKGTDKREVAIAMIRYLLQVSNITSPAIVLYFAAPFCPHSTLQGENEHLINEIKNIAQKVAEETGEQYRFMKFYSSLSDSSYLKIDDTDASVEMLINNFPGSHELYPLPVKEIRELDIPAINYGCYGKDAHKWTERVNIPYTFGVLPLLVKKTIEEMLM